MENETPTTRMAGRTSKVSAQPTMVRTSQKGTRTAVNGRMRPTIALMSDSGSPETAASAWTGVPIAPQATGAVLAIRLSAAAWNGRKPRPIMKAPAIATGAPNPAQPSMNAPKQNATSKNLQAAIRRDSGDGLLHDFELAGFDGNVIEVHRGEHDPGNFQNAKCDAIGKAEVASAAGM